MLTGQRYTFVANNAALIAVGRVLLSLIFILAGFAKLTGSRYQDIVASTSKRVLPAKPV